MDINRLWLSCASTKFIILHKKVCRIFHSVTVSQNVTDGKYMSVVAFVTSQIWGKKHVLIHYTLWHLWHYITISNGPVFACDVVMLGFQTHLSRSSYIRKKPYYNITGDLVFNIFCTGSHIQNSWFFTALLCPIYTFVLWHLWHCHSVVYIWKILPTFYDISNKVELETFMNAV